MRLRRLYQEALYPVSWMMVSLLGLYCLVSIPRWAEASRPSSKPVITVLNIKQGYMTAWTVHMPCTGNHYETDKMNAMMADDFFNKHLELQRLGVSTMGLHSNVEGRPCGEVGLLFFTNKLVNIPLKPNRKEGDKGTT